MENWRDLLYKNYSTTRGKNINKNKLLLEGNKYFDYIIKLHLNKNKNLSILDLACGHGELILGLKRAGFNQIKGIDISEEEVAIAHQLGLSEVVKADVFDFFQNNENKFDIVFMFDILEHLDRQQIMDLLLVVNKCLNQNGFILLQVPNGSGIFGMRIRYGDLTHEICFTKRSIMQILNACNYKMIQCFEVSPIKTGIKGFLRNVLWKILVLPFRIILLLETGENKHILSQNMLVKAFK